MQETGKGWGVGAGLVVVELHLGQGDLAGVAEAAAGPVGGLAIRAVAVGGDGRPACRTHRHNRAALVGMQPALVTDVESDLHARSFI